MNEIDRDKTAHRLRQVISAYGASPHRWPAQERADLERAARAGAHPADLREERALDRLLDQAGEAPVPAGARARLLARAAAAASQSAAPPVIDLSARRAARGRARFEFGVGSWSAVCTLAASLALGLYLGATGSVDSVLPDYFSTTTTEDQVDWASTDDLLTIPGSSVLDPEGDA